MALRKKIASLALAVLAAAVPCTVTADVAAADTGGQAVTYQVDPAHDGYQPNPAISLPLTEQWSVSLGSGSNPGSVDAPLVVGGVVYATLQNSVYAVNLSTGATLWQKSVGTYGALGPAYDNGLIYVADTTGDVSALDPTTGATVWTHDLATDPPYQYEYTFGLTASGGEVYLSGAGDGNTVYALAGATGKLTWESGVLNGSFAMPAVTSSGVYEANACSQDYDLNPATGATIWHYPGDGTGGGGAPSVIGDGSLFGIDGACGGNLILSAGAGTVVGTFSGSTTPAIANGVLYTVANGTLEAISNGGLGAVSWSFTAPPSDNGALETSPLVAGSVVYVGSDSGVVYALNTATGGLLWSANAGTGVNTTGYFNPAGLAVADQALVVPAGPTLTAYTDGTPTTVATGTTLATSTNSSPLGQDVTLTATVQGSDGGGSVSFDVNGAPIAGCSSASLTGTADATATCTTSSLPGGADDVEAQYSGDSGDYGSFGWTHVNVLQTATNTTVAASPSSSSQGQSVTLTATVAPTDGGGSVDFSVGGSAISGCGSAPLASGPGGETATCTTTSLPAGSGETVTAAYSGDNAYSGSSGSTSVTVLGPNANYTWDGASTSPAWSSAANWTGGISPNATVGTLTFPDLTSSACNPPTAGGSPCYTATDNDIAGLSTYGLDIDSDTGYSLGGDALTIGAGGLTATSPSGSGPPPIIGTPIAIGAFQMWNLDVGPVVFENAVSGNYGLQLNFDNGSIEPRSPIEVGSIGTDGSGGFYLDGSTAINATDGAPIWVDGGSGIEVDGVSNAVGPLTVGSDGWLSVGGVDNGGGELTVDGALTFNSSGQLALTVDAPGTAAGLDYSQVNATGNINLTGATLNVSQGVDAQGTCDDLHSGDTLTLLRTSGTINGTFYNYAGGSAVDIVNDCNGADTDASGTLNYSANAVTLTITNAGDAGDVPVENAGPTISGTAEEGQTLTVNPGSWQGQTSFAYSWWACDDVSCDQIPGASSATFIPTADELGDQIYAEVDAIDASGSNTDYTELTAAIAPEPVPSASAAPAVTGQPQVGSVLSATTGTWSDSPTSYAYRWERCSKAGTSCTAIGGATASTYSLASADAGSTILVQVTATNYGGDGSPAQSSPTAVISAVPVSPPSGPSITSITSALHAIAKPAAATSLTKVLKLGGYSFSFKAPSGGRLTVVWTATINKKTITIARASATASAAGSVRVKVTLTAKGKAGLKRLRSLRIKSTSQFTATGMHAVKLSASFTLKNAGASHKGHVTASCLRPRGGRNGRVCVRGARNRLLQRLGMLGESRLRRTRRP